MTNPRATALVFTTSNTTPFIKGTTMTKIASFAAALVVFIPIAAVIFAQAAQIVA